MEPFINQNDVEGVIISGTYEEKTAIEVFCFTAEGVFHAIEVWAEPETLETVAEEIFHSVCSTDVVALREEALNQRDGEDYNEYLEKEYEAALKAAIEENNTDDNSYDEVVRGYGRGSIR